VSRIKGVELVGAIEFVEAVELAGAGARPGLSAEQPERKMSDADIRNKSAVHNFCGLTLTNISNPPNHAWFVAGNS
jgi:hypothetical protein